MKRFWFIIATAGLIAGMNANAAAPFYKVQCYDANDKLVNCNDIAKIKKHAKKSTKSKIAKAKATKETLAQKKARERAIALREIAKQNAELKAEMQALRKANLLAAAKTEEKPAPTAQLAAHETGSTPAMTSSTQIAKDQDSKEESQLAGGLANEMSKSFKSDTPLANELDIWFDYIPSKHITFELEQDLFWNWTTTTTSTDSKFTFSDIMATFMYNDIYHTESKQTQLDGHIQLSLPTTQASRDAGKILAAEFKLKLKTKINDGKGFVKFETKFIPILNKYSTADSSLTDYSPDQMQTIGDQAWEILNPNDRFKMGVKTVFNHKLVDKLNFETSVAIVSAYTYADEVVTGGQTYTLSPAKWKNSMELTLPKIIYSVSDAVGIEGKLVTSTSFNEFKLFNTDSKYKSSDVGFYFKLVYNI